VNKWLDLPVNHVLPGTHLPGYTFFCILKNDILSWRCLHCSFLCLKDACAVLFVHAVHSPLWPWSHDHCTWRCLHCSFQNLMRFLRVCCWDESLQPMTWCGIQSLLLRIWWKLATEEIAPPDSCLINRNNIRPFEFSTVFSYNMTRTAFSFFVCQLIQQQNLKRLKVCFQIWEWFRSRDGNALYPYVKCPKCFSETINKNKQPLRLIYQNYKLSRITAWDPRKICGTCFHVIISGTWIAKPWRTHMVFCWSVSYADLTGETITDIFMCV